MFEGIGDVAQAGFDYAGTKDLSKLFQTTPSVPVGNTEKAYATYQEFLDDQ